MSRERVMTFKKSSLFCVSFSLFLARTLLMPEALLAADKEMNFLRWRVASQERTRDGGMTVSFELRGPSGTRWEDVEIVCRAMPREGVGTARSYGDPDVYRKRASKNVTIYSGRSELIELLAEARVGDARHYASIVVNCYGESGKTDPDAEAIDDAPLWPVFRVDTGSSYFRAQTGTPIELWLEAGPPFVEVFENGATASAAMTSIIERSPSGKYSYTSPHDEELAKSGYTAKKDVTFVAAIPGGSVSFCLPVYRAFYGRTSLGGGLVLLSSSAAATLALVIGAGRRFPWR
ncbi:MAG: hypothetical protein LBQ42_02570 [Synergistaceae bacterium]|jgi:hypothetical protein|nr:hypothetical protein [Synergistaceae bacterium]